VVVPAGINFGHSASNTLYIGPIPAISRVERRSAELSGKRHAAFRTM
jgi:hypothetical protein